MLVLLNTENETFHMKSFHTTVTSYQTRSSHLSCCCCCCCCCCYYYYYINTINNRGIKLERTIWVGHVACMVMWECIQNF